MLAADFVSLHTLTVSCCKLFVKRYKKKKRLEIVVDNLMTRL